MEQSTSPPRPAGGRAKSLLKHNSNGRSKMAFNDITGRSNALSKSQQNFSILKKTEKEIAMKPCNKVTTMSRRHSVAPKYTSPKLEEKTTVGRTPITNIKKPWETSVGLNETSNSNSNKVVPRASKPFGGSSTTNKMTSKQIQSGLYTNKSSIPLPHPDPRSRRSSFKDKTNKDFSVLETAKYWLEHIKLSEAAKKHAISIEFFRLAAECNAEPNSLLQRELVAYLHRHSICSGDTDKLPLSYGIKEQGQRVSCPNQNSGASFSDKESEVIDLSMSLPAQTPMLNEVQPEMDTNNWSQGCAHKAMSTSENTKCSVIINPVEAGPVENAGKYVLETVGKDIIHCDANSLETSSMESMFVPAITRDLEHSPEAPLTDKETETIGEGVNSVHSFPFITSTGKVGTMDVESLLKEEVVSNIMPSMDGNHGMIKRESNLTELENNGDVRVSDDLHNPIEQIEMVFQKEGTKTVEETNGSDVSDRNEPNLSAAELLNLKVIVLDNDTGGRGNDQTMLKEMPSDDVTKCERTRRKTINPLAPQIKKSNKPLVDGNSASVKQKTPSMPKIVATHPQNSNVCANAEEKVSATRNTGSGNTKNSQLRRSLSKQNPSNQNNSSINQRRSKLGDKPDKLKTALMGDFDNPEGQESMATPGSGGER